MDNFDPKFRIPPDLDDFANGRPIARFQRTQYQTVTTTDQFGNEVSHTEKDETTYTQTGIFHDHTHEESQYDPRSGQRVATLNGGVVGLGFKTYDVAPVRTAFQQVGIKAPVWQAQAEAQTAFQRVGIKAPVWQAQAQAQAQTSLALQAPVQANANQASLLLFQAELQEYQAAQQKALSQVQASRKAVLQVDPPSARPALPVRPDPAVATRTMFQQAPVVPVPVRQESQVPVKQPLSASILNIRNADVQRGHVEILTGKVTCQVAGPVTIAQSIWIGQTAYSSMDYGSRAGNDIHMCFYVALSSGNEAEALQLKQDLGELANLIQTDLGVQHSVNFGSYGAMADFESVCACVIRRQHPITVVTVIDEQQGHAQALTFWPTVSYQTIVRCGIVPEAAGHPCLLLCGRHYTRLFPQPAELQAEWQAGWQAEGNEGSGTYPENSNFGTSILASAASVQPSWGGTAEKPTVPLAVFPSAFNRIQNTFAPTAQFPSTNCEEKAFTLPDDSSHFAPYSMPLSGYRLPVAAPGMTWTQNNPNFLPPPVAPKKPEQTPATESAIKQNPSVFRSSREHPKPPHG